MLRRWWWILLLAGWLGLTVQAGGTPGTGDFLALQRRVVDIFGEHRNSVLRVKAAFQRVNEEGEPYTVQQVGSGFFISREGHIITVARVTYMADRVWVEHDGVEYAAEMLGSDLFTNFSLLRLVTLPDRFSFVRLPDNAEMPAIGSAVLAITAPLDFAPSPNFGLVSGIESSFGNRTFPCAYVRINLQASPGEIGSPVLDLEGRLVGMMVAGIVDLDSAYVLPARAALKLRDDLLFGGEVSYGWVGFDIRVERTRQRGVELVIGNIVPGSPADEAGLRDGDVLLRFAGEAVGSAADLRNAFFYTREGQYVRIQVQRLGEEREYNVRIGRRPPTLGVNGP
jgi:serine protease Do